MRSPTALIPPPTRCDRRRSCCRTTSASTRPRVPRSRRKREWRTPRFECGASPWSRRGASRITSMNIANDSLFDSPNFTPTRLLGEGVWGRVYDLDDGTVLKIAREACAGIGSGGAKIENECIALQLLAATGALAGLIPVVRGRGEIPPTSPLAAEGFAIWLRMTKVPGRSISPKHVSGLSRSQQSRIARDVGVAVARVQAALLGCTCGSANGSCACQRHGGLRRNHGRRGATGRSI